MQQGNTHSNQQQRRAGVRRTARIAAAIAVTVFVLFVVKQGLWH